jgi:hypothetical protein
MEIKPKQLTKYVCSIIIIAQLFGIITLLSRKKVFECKTFSQATIVCREV